MKVAPTEKKAKSLPSRLLKPKAFKAGAAVTKKNKETLMKGISEASLASNKQVLRTGSSRISAPSKDAKSPGLKQSFQQTNGKADSPKQLITKLAANKRKSLPAMLSVASKGTPKKDADDKLLKASKRKSFSIASQEENSELNVSKNQASKPEKEKDAVGISTPLKLPLELLKRKSIVSSRRNSFTVKPLEQSTPSLESDTPKKTAAVSFPDKSVKSPKKKSVAVTPVQVKTHISTPVLKSGKDATPAAESAKTKKLLSKRKSCNTSSINDEVSTPVAESKKLKRKSLAVATPSKKTKSESEATVAKQSGLVSEQKKAAVTPSSSGKRGAGATPLVSDTQKSDSKGLKRKALTVTSPTDKTDEPNVELSPAKVKKFSQKEKQAGKKSKSQKKGKGTDSVKELSEEAAEEQEGSLQKSKARLLEKKSRKLTPEQAEESDDTRFHNLVDAAGAVLNVVDKKQTSKKHLFAGDAQPIALQIHVVRIPRTPPRILRFNVPHSIYEDNANICLILGDPIKGRKRDTEQEVIVEDYKEMLGDKGVKNIKEVIPFNYLRAQYGPFEMKRRFSQTYDVVLCDTRFLGHAQHFLGKEYFTRKTITPVRVYNENKGEWVDDFKSAIDFALHKTWMRIHPKGTTYSVTVGNTQLTKEQIAANILAVFKELKAVFPGGLENIKMALIKSHQGLPVPVFASLKPHDEVEVPVAKDSRARRGEPATDEVSTLPGREVTVYPVGRIEVRSKMTSEDKEYEKSMGHESRWKRQQRKIAKQKESGRKETGEEEIGGEESEGEESEGEENGGEESEGVENGGEESEGEENGGEESEGEETEEKEDGSKRDKKKSFQGKKSTKKSFAAGKVVSPGKKFSGKKSFSGKRTAESYRGKKPNLVKGKKAKKQQKS